MADEATYMLRRSVVMDGAARLLPEMNRRYQPPPRSVKAGRGQSGLPARGRHLARGASGLRPEPAPAEICRVLTGHLENLYSFYGEYTGVRMARKHIAWYSKHQRDGNRFRQRINRTETAAEQLEYVRRYFAALEEQQEMAA